MSSYVNFYLKNGKTGAITYLFGYSRSSAIYEIFYGNFLCFTRMIILNNGLQSHKINMLILFLFEIVFF